jgi:hypothetical protein|tara:strand:- start:286 stop:660 length:375 start_codon:yes stop_codon:yes gene_type:complete
MGLDMWATITKGKEGEQIADWRKHNRLHGFMEQLWEDKGCPKKDNDDQTFNCIPLELNKEDLKELKATILTRALPETQGFFFGHDSYDWSKDELKDADKYDLEFVTNALKALKDGYRVHYNSWW